MNTTSRWLWIALAAAAGWALCVAAGTLLWPFGRDQGIFAWAGDVIVRGGLPYRDAWEVKGPATHYAYALAQLVFGRTPLAARALDLALLAGGGWALVALLRTHAAAHWTRAAAALVLCFLHWRLGLWNSAQPDPWAASLTTAALAVLASGVGVGRGAAAGGLIALAALLKPPFALLGAVPLCYAALAAPPPERLRVLASLAAGAAAVAVVALAGFAAGGALPALIDVQLGFNGSVHQGQHARSLGEHGLALLAWIAHPRVALLVVLAAYGAATLQARSAPLAAALALWLALGVALVALQDKHYLYHYALLYPPLVVAAAFGLESAARTLQERSQWAPPALLALVLALHAPGANWNGLRAVFSGPEAWARYEARAAENPRGGYSFANTRAAAERLRAITDRDETLFFWGFDPALYFLADRAGASRFGFAYPMIVSEGTPYQERYRDELLANLAAAPPAVFVVAHADTNNLQPEPSDLHLRRFAALDRWLRANYQPGERIGRYALWLSRPATEPVRAP